MSRQSSDCNEELQYIIWFIGCAFAETSCIFVLIAVSSYLAQTPISLQCMHRNLESSRGLNEFRLWTQKQCGSIHIFLPQVCALHHLHAAPKRERASTSRQSIGALKAWLCIKAEAEALQLTASMVKARPRSSTPFPGIFDFFRPTGQWIQGLTTFSRLS